MKTELYENTYTDTAHFCFGKNWQNFILSLDEKRIEKAKESLIKFLGGPNKIKDKTFVDIGCGSGLFSLAACLLGAQKVISIDVDEFSIACASHLKKEKGSSLNWEILQGSALDESFIKSLGKFDIVYSWGVLHHTGNMYKALKNVTTLLKPDSILYLALYNENKHRFTEGTSKFWYKIKKFYNKSGALMKKVILYFYMSYFILGLMLAWKNPVKYIKNYQSARGMNWHNDILDWIGGYPYEYASVAKIIYFFRNLGFSCKKYIAARSIGCNEFLFSSSLDRPIEIQNKKISVVIPVYNSYPTIDRCIESIFNQTYKEIIVICINDASTDKSLEKLFFLQKKYGSDKIIIVSSEKNLGVAKSLNRGLGLVKTKYTARIDADDWWGGNKIARQMKFLEQNQDYGIIGCNYINYNGNIEKKVYTRENNNLIKKNIIKRNPFAHSCVIYDTGLVKKVGGYDESIKYGSDYDLYMRLFPLTKFYNLQEFLCFRAIENEGISIKRQREQMLQGVKTQAKYIRKYNLSKINYIFSLELLIVAFTPKIIRDIKRAILG
jgi:2-polyprenyl-6-hydroxyphenyl methylase/3-demethylubiquinone-9 3-methyltransferase